MENKPLEKYKLELKELNKENSGLFTKINCPSCEAGVPVTNLHLKDKIGKCTNCNTVFSFRKDIAHFIQEEKKEKISRPAGINVIHFQEEVDFEIDQPGSSDIIGILLFASMALIATLIFFEKGISIFIPGTLWLGCAYYLYQMLTRRKKKIFINIDQNNMTIKWRPKEMMKDKVIDVKDIDQVYLKRHGHQYTLHLILNDVEGQKHVPLITYYYTSLAKARYLEQEIEKYLGIKDRKVPESNVKD